MAKITNLKKSLVIAAVLVGIHCAIAAAGTIYVDVNTPDNNDGSSWAKAYKYLQDALAVAQDGNDIWVAAGTYYSDEDKGANVDPNDRTETFQLINGVAIYGGFPSGGMWEDRDPNAYVTILSGDLLGNDGPGEWENNGDNSYHVVTGSGTDANAVLDGFTITAGNANGGASNDYGGGMFNYEGSPTLTNCTFSGNSAGSFGGGMFNQENSSPTLTNCSFSGNSADGGGGGMSNSGGSPTVANCTFSENLASPFGGGMYNNLSSPTVTNCTFTGNCSSQYGGGMYNNLSSPTVTNCTFSGNSVLSYHGGGMSNSQSSPTVTNCTFSGNSAVGFGGGMNNCLSSSPIVTNCSFSGNSADGGGGGMNNGGGGYCGGTSSPTVTNCTFSGNSAGSHGGGMCNRKSSSPTVTNCTFSGNSAGGYGGGMWNDYYSSPTLTNCILWGDTADTAGAEIALRSSAYPSTLTISYSDVEGGEAAVYVDSGCTLNWDANSNIEQDPNFVDANGPDGIIGTEDDNLRLLRDSNCIDAGDNTAVPGGVTTDLDGNPRFIDDPCTADTGNGTLPIVDMGAYEYQPPPPAIIYVDANATGVNNGWSWENAFTELRDALSIAAEFPDVVEQVRVAEGVYRPAGPSGDRTTTFQLINGVAIYGGFPSSGDPNLNDRDPNAYVTILSGDLLGNDGPGEWENNGENSYHVVTASHVDPNTILDGFTITGGNADGSYPDNHGGGMNNWQGSPMVTNCTFSGNSADTGGGGMHNDEYSSPMVTNCTFSGNSADIGGGGMHNDEYSSPMVTNCTFSGNIAGDTVGYGGGMYNHSSTGSTNTSASLLNCTFTGNSAEMMGGGMYNKSGTGFANTSASLVSCTFTGNSAEMGGGMYNASGTGNANTSASLVSCTFTGNSAETGGGMYNASGTSDANTSVSVVNCTFTGNSAEMGGGMYNASGTGDANTSVSVVNCTFSGNAAPNGGGMYNLEGFMFSRTTVEAANCIFWDNCDVQIFVGSGETDVSYSCVGGGLAGVYIDPNCSLIWGPGNIDADPLFVEPGRWVDANDPNIIVEPNDPNAVWVDGDYHLKSEGWRWTEQLIHGSHWYYDFTTSRCIDAGNPGSPLRDEPMNVPDDPDNIWGENIRINMGAYGRTAEASMAPYDWVLLADLTNDGMVDFEDFAGQANGWEKGESEQPGDLNRDSEVSAADLALLVEDWLEQTSWH